MKRITTIGAKNFKGVDFKHDLHAVNLIIGPNWAHKTARLDATQLALAGYHPAVKRTNGEIFESFAGDGDELIAALQFDDDFGVGRTYTKRRDAVKCVVRCSDERDDWTCNAVLIDAGAYLSLTARERVKYLFQMLDLSKIEVKPEAISAEVKNIKLEENTEHTENAIKSVAKFVCDSFSAAKQTVQEWLENLVSDLRDKKLEAERDAKRLTQTVAGLTQMRADETPVNLNRPIDAELATARQALEATASEGATLGERLKHIVNENEKASARYTTAANDRAYILRKNDARRVEIETIVSNTRPYSALLENLQSELAGVREKQKAGPDRKPAFEAVLNAERELAEGRTGAQGMRDILAASRSRADGNREDVTPCECCGKVGLECEAAVKRQKPLDEKVAADEERLRLTTATLGERINAAEKARAALQLIDEQIEAEKKLSAEAERLLKAISELQSAQNLEATLRAELISIAAPPEPMVPALTNTTELETQVQQLRAAYTAKKKTVEELEGVQRQINAVRAETANKAKAVAEAKQSQAMALVWSEAVKLVEQRQQKLVTDAFASVLATANQLCGPILKTPLAYHEGEIGRWQGSRFIRHATFSGTEKAITYAAICVALGARSSFRLVTVDELGRMDSSNKAKFLELIKRLVRDDVIDQFIGIDVDAVDYQLEGVNVITLN
jgi:hypothetical protein